MSTEFGLITPIVFNADKKVGRKLFNVDICLAFVTHCFVFHCAKKPVIVSFAAVVWRGRAMLTVPKSKLRDAETELSEGLNISNGRETGWWWEIGRNRMKWTARHHRSKRLERKWRNNYCWKGSLLRREKKNKAKEGQKRESERESLRK